MSVPAGRRVCRGTTQKQNFLPRLAAHTRRTASYTLVGPSAILHGRPGLLHPVRPGCREVPVDFLERIFGIAPDGGSGWFEVLLFLLPIAGIAWIVRQRRRDQDGQD